MSRVLVVDDEPQILRAMRVNLRARGYDVATAGDGREVLDAAVAHPPDTVVLDLGLPDIDGVDVIAGLRGWTNVPILVLSGRSGSSDKVEALDAGADDYVTKPFGMDELLARLRAMLRRNLSTEAEPVVEFGDVLVDLPATRVTVNGAEIHLTPTEWHLLEVLVRNPGKLISQRQLLLEVWGPGYETAQGNLRLYMAQLRRKLEPDPARPRYFRNEPGMGYRFDPSPPTSALASAPDASLAADRRWTAATISTSSVASRRHEPGQRRTHTYTARPGPRRSRVARCQVVPAAAL